MATYTIKIENYQRDGITLRTSWEVTNIGIADTLQIPFQDTLTFEHVVPGGMGRGSFTVYDDEENIPTQAGDVIKVLWEGVKRYEGRVSALQKVLNESNPNIDATRITCENMVNYDTRSLIYDLKESANGKVSTDIDTVLRDAFLANKYTAKNQDFNVGVTTNSNVTFTDAVTLPSLSTNAYYDKASLINVILENISKANGTLYLTTVEPYIGYIDGSNAFIIKQREDSTTPIATFALDTGHFRVKHSVDMEDYAATVDSKIINQIIINGVDYTLSGSQYWTQIQASQNQTTGHGIKQKVLTRDNLHTDRIQEWVDSKLLNMLEPLNIYRFKPRKSDSPFVFTWFNGSTDVPDGYVKITGATGGDVLSPFRRCVYRFTAAGWERSIELGEYRPDLDLSVLTDFTGFGSYSIMGSTHVLEPSETADDSTFSGQEIFDFGEFQFIYDNPNYEITAANVNFIVKARGGDFWNGGAVVKTITSSTTPLVRTSDNKLFKCTWYNSNATGISKAAPNGIAWSIGLTNDRIYYVGAKVTVSIDGVDQVIDEQTPTAFKLKSQTTSDKSNDSFNRMPDAETDLVKEYTPVTTLMRARKKFFSDTGGSEAPPDGGAKGWFITDDEIAGSWTRMTGDFAGNITGTTNNDFEVNADGSAGQYMTLTLNSDTAGAVGILRYDKTNTKWEISTDDGSTYSNLATGVSNAINDVFNSLTYEWKVNSADGSVTYVEDPAGTPVSLFKIAADGAITTYDSIEPDTDDVAGNTIGSWDSVGGTGKRYTHLYVSNAVITTDLIGSSVGDDDLANADWYIEYDATEGKAFPYNIALGFMD